MAKFRKKPVVIDAIRYEGKEDNNRVINWLASLKASIGCWLVHDNEIIIPTLEGNMKVSPGDYLIRGVKGEYYPCKPDIFLATYDEVKE